MARFRTPFVALFLVLAMVACNNQPASNPTLEPRASSDCAKRIYQGF